MITLKKILGTGPLRSLLWRSIPVETPLVCSRDCILFSLNNNSLLLFRNITTYTFISEAQEKSKKPVKCINITQLMPPNTLILNQAGMYSEEERVLFSCSRGFYPTGPNVVMSSVCRNGSLVHELSNGECMKGLVNYFHSYLHLID